MVISRLIAMLKNRDKIIVQCLKDRSNYTINPDKTNQGKLISCYEYDIRSVDAKFLITERDTIKS